MNKFLQIFLLTIAASAVLGAEDALVEPVEDISVIKDIEPIDKPIDPIKKSCG